MSLSLLSIRGFLLALVAYGADVPAATFINSTGSPTGSPTAPTGSPTEPIEPITVPNLCLNMTTGSVQLVTLGVPTTTDFITNETYTPLVLKLDPTCTVTRQFVGVLSIANIPNNTDDGFIIESRFVPVPAPGKSAEITNKKGADLVVSYVCPKVPTNYTVLLTIYFPDTDDDPITATWEKHCFPAPPAAPTKADEGWSTAGILFFTVFMITLVFCVLGCGYNYVQQGRAGADIIPCISVFRACKAKAQGDRGYSPQMDYTSADKVRASDGGDGAYGSVYHTDL